MRFLLLSTLYSFLIPLNGCIGLFDAAVLLAIFLFTCARRCRAHPRGVGAGRAGRGSRRASATRRDAWSWPTCCSTRGLAIFVSAEPFAEGLVHIGTSYDIDEFLLVQWVAPLASESPEFVIALLFALAARGALGLGALISSKVNQWTLLVGALPIAYALAGARWVGLPLDERQTEELLLTSAQSLLATLLICDLDFCRARGRAARRAFGVQLFFPDTQVRYAFSFLYLAIFVLLLASRRAAPRLPRRSLRPLTPVSVDVDVLVVGRRRGGPGLRAALARRGRRVVVLERTRGSRARPRAATAG